MSTTASVSGSHAAAKSSASSHATAAKGAPGQGADAFAALLQALGAADGGDAGTAMPALATDLTDAGSSPSSQDGDQSGTQAAADPATLAATPAAASPSSIAVAMQPADLPAAMLAWAGGAHAVRGEPAGKAGQDAASDGADATATIGTGSAASGKHGPRGARGDTGVDRPEAADAAPRAAGAAPVAFKADAVATRLASTQESTTSSAKPAHELAPALLAGAHVPTVPDLPQAAPATPVHQAALPSHPLDAAFAGDLAAEVQVMAGAGLQRAELQLHPADLGPVRIELAITAQTADLQFHAANATTREGLENALPQLREALAASGLHLGQASVGSGAQPQADPGAWREQQARAQQSLKDRGRGSGGVAAGPTATTVAVRRNRGLLDLYA